MKEEKLTREKKTIRGNRNRWDKQKTNGKSTSLKSS